MTRSCERRKHVVVGAGTRYGRVDWISLSVYVAVGMSCPAAGVAGLGHNCSGGRAGRREPAFLHPSSCCSDMPSPCWSSWVLCCSKRWT